MPRGPKPLTPAIVTPVDDPSIDQEKLQGAMVQMRADATAEQQRHETDLFELGRQVGAIQMAQVHIDTSAAAQVRLFEEIKESNKYKDLRLTRPDGTSATAENLAEFCRLVFGASYSAMAERLQDLHTLGEASYDNVNRLGLNRKQLRLIRTLPEESILMVRQAMTSANKAEVVAVIEDLASKLASTQEELETERSERQADQQLLKRKGEKIEEQARQLRRVKTEAPDEVLQKLQLETTKLMQEARACLIGHLRQGFVALRGHHETVGKGNESDAFMTGILSQLGSDLQGLAVEFDLSPEIDSDPRPEWLRDQKAEG